MFSLLKLGLFAVRSLLTSFFFGPNRRESIEEEISVLCEVMNVIKIFYLPTDAQQSCFKRILKFTLKQLLHVSVQ
jgi:hypothetical protein